jgi:pyrimidine-nucleoside phosphorylase
LSAGPPVDARAFLRVKREGGRHAPADLERFVLAAARGEIPDYQTSAWLMAAFLNGLSDAERDALTRALVASGRCFDWQALGRPSADKHSTGGVGDKISLVLAPLVAACGVLVPMVSGRGLGHTGGTLDKLESIPGFGTQLPPEAMRAQLDRLGVVMVGQGPELAPADGLLYALRDATSTVERPWFIVPSIVSKKVAEGAGSLVYDVKCGSGAFMKSRDEAVSLARQLVAVTRAMGRRAAARVTDMSQPLGAAVGNALEVLEAGDVLRGGGPADVRALTLELAQVMLTLSGRPAGEARVALERALAGGAAWERWLALIEAQGGDRAAVERGQLPRAPVVMPVPAPHDGVLAAVDGFALGELVVSLGGGRRAREDVVDPRVGLVMRRRIGDRIARGEPVMELHLAHADDAVARHAAACVRIGEHKVPPPPLVLEQVE